MSQLFWAGSQDSFNTYLEAEKHWGAISPEAFGMPISDDDVEQERVPDLVSAAGNVAIITVKGSLVNEHKWWHSYAGVTSYESIREALIYVLGNDSYDKILMDFGTGGGAVAGCSDTALLISAVSEFKSVYSFSDSHVASAGYWLASASEKRYASSTSLWGSIGVLLKHAENSKMRKEAGITDTIFRSGEFKGLGLTEEKLSELAKDDFQEKVMYLSDIFTGAVADNLNITSDYVNSIMGGGREFIGQQAVEVGLCTAVSNFDTVLNDLQKAEESAGGITMPKKALTAQAIAALAASGASPAELEASGGGTDVDGGVAPVLSAEELAAKAVIDAQATTDADAQAKADAKAVADAKLESDENPVTLESTTAALASAVAKNELLAEQVSAKDEELIALKVVAKSTENLVAAMAGLKIIAAKAINNMQVALGSSASDLTASDADSLVTMHASTSTQFETSFKPGAAAVVDTDKPTKVVDDDNTSAVGF